MGHLGILDILVGSQDGMLLALTDFPEGGELLPAGDEGAAAGHAVALAGHLHV